MAVSFFQVLGVSVDSSDAEVKAAWRRMVRVHHPDTGGSAEQFARVQEAYAALSSQEGRDRYAAYQGNARTSSRSQQTSSEWNPSPTPEGFAPGQSPPKWFTDNARPTSRTASADFSSPRGARTDYAASLRQASRTFAAYARATGIALLAMAFALTSLLTAVFTLVSPYEKVAFNATTWWVGSFVALALFSQLMVAFPRYRFATTLAMVMTVLGTPYLTSPMLGWWAGACALVSLVVFLARRLRA